MTDAAIKNNSDNAKKEAMETEDNKPLSNWRNRAVRDHPLNTPVHPPLPAAKSSTHDPRVAARQIIAAVGKALEVAVANMAIQTIVKE